MMAVIQSKGLPSARRELENIRRHVSCDALVELGVPGVPAGVEAVASHLSNVSIVHFACHGQGGGGTWKVYQHSLFFFQASPGPPSLPIFLNLVCFP